MAHPLNNWSCIGAYDKLAYASITEAFDAKGVSIGFILTCGYEDGRVNRDLYDTAEAAHKSGYDWVLSCDWWEAPEAVRECYADKDHYVTGNVDTLPAVAPAVQHVIVHVYRPAVSCTMATIDVFNAETNRVRQAMADGIPFSLYSSSGWVAWNSHALPFMARHTPGLLGYVGQPAR